MQPAAAKAVALSEAEAEALFAPLAAEERLLVAVSGGPDSVALLVLLTDWARACAGRPAIHAATVDHGLRSEAAAEAAAVGLICSGLAVHHAVLRWEGEKPGSGLQEQARLARYELLAGQARVLGGAVIVTAHTLDDQAETLLMRMAKGSGPAGLVGMRARTVKEGVPLARPLLGVAKQRLVATCLARGLDHASDPSNEDPRFIRVRWRALMPQLAEEGLTPTRLAQLASRLARAEQALDQRAAGLLPALSTRGGDGLRLDFVGLCREPDEIVIRVLARALAVSQPEAEMRLERLESCALALAEAARRGAALRRTLAGCMLRLTGDGALMVAPEPPRRRGVHPEGE
ncbi:tRNA lysidine(34) synthetase TilS [Bosea sp. WAO]|uniref:tRNA lysidine(34) synthetase TilS n=1 Tax=Bosea sp. WAO TaxID=406341 RepID=UPI0009FAFDEE|nr:tRNA lysidine(34) synthetase TilS [Bosea sp. WAO]